MKFIDEAARDDLAKSSTILQCILSILDFECHKYLNQPEVLTVYNNIATIDLDPMGDEEIMEACKVVNNQFKRKDGGFTCSQQEYGKGIVRCEARHLHEYLLLT